ncbi:hypothetical protein EJB05_57505 [Eragrostis curvula]|uniref:S-acyltransferase n=1 Tax=Eragrostis curvula TaxID=38414 RepID=A0A5J9SEJ7_9POAL|nr:hypothetical protein EJB05_57505 [Eragrostis curvula]
MMKGRTLFKSPLHHRSHLSDAASSSSGASSSAAAAVATHRLYQVWRGKNRFCCGGRLIFGPDASSIVLTVALIMTPLALFVAFVSFRLADLIGKPLGLAVPAIAIVVGVFDVVVLVLTSGRDPGIIPRNARPPDPEDFSTTTTAAAESSASPAAASTATGQQQLRPSWSLPPTRDVTVNGTTVKVKYCHTCMLYRPPRCSHCSVCNNCVERFDHHCPWVGQCIGRRNYRFFFFFIASTTFLCLYVHFSCWAHLVLSARARGTSLAFAVVEVSPASGFLIAYTFVTAWFVGGLTAFHSYLVATNQTTYENFRYRYEGKANPFNRGAAANVTEIFLSPIPPSRNDFRAKVSMADPDAVALYYSLGPLASESRISFYTRGSLSFDMAKASFDLDYSAKRTSVASSDFGDIGGYGGGGAASRVERCSTAQQPRHSIFGGGGGAGRESRKVEDEADAVTAELGTAMQYGGAAGRPHGREFEVV